MHSSSLQSGAEKKDIMQEKTDSNNYDVIVIGSGLSGIATAGLFSKMYKKKVLVLEKHYEPGGLTHEFKRGPYSWDVGLHYMADMKKRLFDNIGLFLFRYLTNGKLQWNKTTDPFDKLIFPDMTININENAKEYKKTLIKQFPHQKKAIKKYMRDIHLVRLWYLCDIFMKFLHPPISFIFKILRKINLKKALMTTAEYLDKNISDNKLKAVLSTRWGNYGIPPTESAFAIHSLIEHHFYSGSTFPKGGAEKICTYIEETIESSEGKILINHEAIDILLENKKAVGVRTKNLAVPKNPIKEFFAPIIISSVGVKNTYLNLLPRNFNFPIQNKLQNFFSGYSALNIYLGLKESPKTLGIHGENYWIVNSYALDEFTKNNKDIFNSNPNYCFVSFPSIKSGKKNGHTAEIVTIFPSKAFKKWKTTYWKERSNTYYALKDKMIEKYLDLVEQKIPGLKKLVVYKEMATPLTFKHFTNRMEGTFYGLPAIPERYKLTEIKVKSPIKKLYLTGTDILSNGVMPALISGMLSVSYIRGAFAIFNILFKILFHRLPKIKKQTKKSNFTSNQKDREDKAYGRLIQKKQISDNTIELTFHFEHKLNFIPGQHVKLLVNDDQWRAYSIAKSDDYNLSLIIDTRPDGYGSKYAKNIKINEYSLFRLFLTDLFYHESKNDLMFIATGTGFVPFIHILDELMKKKKKHKAIILFGCLKEEDNYIDNYVKPYEKYFSIKKHICVDFPESNNKYFKGRVTDFLEQTTYNLKNYDFYICGHPNMTNAVTKLLRSKGVERIFW
jgi:all-trans-retinol 13,14-reductase